MLERKLTSVKPPLHTHTQTHIIPNQPVVPVTRVAERYYPVTRERRYHVTKDFLRLINVNSNLSNTQGWISV